MKGRIFESGEFTDLIIRTEEKEYKVHRAIVCCQSDVFSRMCLSPFKVCRDPKTVEEIN